jgi:hypothetical protein
MHSTTCSIWSREMKLWDSGKTGAIQMAPALKVLLGPEAKGLSANTVSRLKRD